MVLVEYYALLAVSVGLWACVDFIPEVRKRLFEANHLDDVMYANPYIVFFTLLTMSTLLAPLVVPSILIT